MEVDLLLPDAKVQIDLISIASILFFPYRMTSSDGFQVSPVSKITGKCFFSQSLGTRERKCIIVPVVSKGMNTVSLEIPKSSSEVKGSSLTSKPYERI